MFDKFLADAASNPSVYLSHQLARAEGPGRLLSSTDFALVAGQAAKLTTKDNIGSFLSIVNRQMDGRGFSAAERKTALTLIQSNSTCQIEP